MKSKGKIATAFIISYFTIGLVVEAILEATLQAFIQFPSFNGISLVTSVIVVYFYSKESE